MIRPWMEKHEVIKNYIRHKSRRDQWELGGQERVMGVNMVQIHYIHLENVIIKPSTMHN